MQMVDVQNVKQYQDLLLDETPVCVLDCGHIFTSACMDQAMGMPHFYKMSKEGEHSQSVLGCMARCHKSRQEPRALMVMDIAGACEGLKAASGNFQLLKTCPRCKDIVSDRPRYARVIRKATLDLLDFKAARASQQALQQTDGRLHGLKTRTIGGQSDEQTRFALNDAYQAIIQDANLPPSHQVGCEHALLWAAKHFSAAGPDHMCITS